MASSFKTPALGFSGRTEKTGKRAEPTIPRASLSAFGLQSLVLSAVLLPESFKAEPFSSSAALCRKGALWQMINPTVWNCVF
jgi:hypothetical protein